MKEFGETRQALEETMRNFKVNKNDVAYILAILDSNKHNICNEKTIFKKIGGAKTIEFIVKSFYLKAHQHPNLCEYFNKIDIKTMITNQKFWFSKFFDNANIKPYHFKDLRSLHLGMGISKEAFSIFGKTLVEGLKEFGHNDEQLLREALEWLQRCQNDLLDLKSD